MPLIDFLTQRRWKLLDGLWLLNGIYIKTTIEMDTPYNRYPQELKNKIDDFELNGPDGEDKDSILMRAKRSLEDYENTKYIRIADNKELKWLNIDDELDLPFHETEFSKSELHLISLKVAQLDKRFETTADLKYCELPYQDEGNTYHFSPLSQWNKEYLIEWASQEMKLNIAWLTDKIAKASSSIETDSNSPVEKQFDVKKLTNNIEEFHMWVYNKLVNLSNQGEPKPTMAVMLGYIKKDCKDYVKTHGPTIHYWSADASDDASWSKDALKMFIQRHTLEPNKKQNP